MVEVDSGDVLEMRDARVSDLIDDINTKSERAALTTIVGWVGGVASTVLLFVNAALAGFALLATVLAWLFAKWLDSYQRRSVIFYDLEPDAQAAYEALTNSFDAMNGCVGKWHVSAGGQVTDLATWKRNAGASHIVRKAPTVLAYSLPNVVASNITPPSAVVGAQILYFLPDVVLVVHGRKAGAVGYADLQLRSQPSNFIEDGAVPRDAIVVGQTWQHPNKNGGPDRRFRNNRQIPVCQYEVLHLKSASGLNELLEFSRCGVSGPFEAAVARLAAINAQSRGHQSRLSAT